MKKEKVIKRLLSISLLHLHPSVPFSCLVDTSKSLLVCSREKNTNTKLVCAHHYHHCCRCRHRKIKRRTRIKNRKEVKKAAISYDTRQIDSDIFITNRMEKYVNYCTIFTVFLNVLFSTNGFVSFLLLCTDFVISAWMAIFSQSMIYRKKRCESHVVACVYVCIFLNLNVDKTCEA